MADKIRVKPNRSRINKRTCERRVEHRLLCSDLVQIYWLDPQDGARRGEIVILENLSPLGVGVFTGVAIPLQVELELSANGSTLRGVVRQCMFRENGYIVGIELHPESRWAQDPRSGFLPEHLLDVSRLDLG